MFTVEVPGELINSDVEQMCEEQNNENLYETIEDVEPFISVNAVAWNQNFQTMILKEFLLGN